MVNQRGDTYLLSGGRLRVGNENRGGVMNVKQSMAYKHLRRPGTDEKQFKSISATYKLKEAWK